VAPATDDSPACSRSFVESDSFAADCDCFGWTDFAACQTADCFHMDLVANGHVRKLNKYTNRNKIQFWGDGYQSKGVKDEVRKQEWLDEGRIREPRHVEKRLKAKKLETFSNKLSLMMQLRWILIWILNTLQNSAMTSGKVKGKFKYFAKLCSDYKLSQKKVKHFAKLSDDFKPMKFEIFSKLSDSLFCTQFLLLLFSKLVHFLSISLLHFNAPNIWS
jgi:hypothetical protein